MNKIIAVDLDETLAELLEGALKFHNFTIKGKKVSKEDIEDYYIENIKKLNLSRQEAIDWFYSFIESEAMHNIKLAPGAKTKLEELKTKGYLLYILTARREERESITKRWLDKNLPNIFKDNQVIFANHFTEKARSKGELCKEIGATLMIEDNLDYAKELAGKGIKTYLLEKPRNKQYDNSNPNIIKVKTRNDIIL